MNDGTQELKKRNASKATALRVRVISPQGERIFSIANSVMTVGRHPSNHIVVQDPNVSGVHLELRLRENGVSIRDQATTNGTWLGGQRIVEALLSEGALLRIGESTLQLEATEETRASIATNPTRFGAMIGESTPMRELFGLASRIAPRDLSVLIQGETGTGKEELARAIHAESPRSKQPFIVIDATTLPDGIAETLLFGNEKGAFTGANERRQGFFEAANNGTVLLDEVGELSPSLQAKFLRVLERKEIVRVGSHTPISVNVRVLAATHRDLRVDIEKGKFREDLYFRLSHVRLFVPPLRDRADDIEALSRACADALEPAMGISAEALEYLRAQRFPGNVRELRNAILRGAALATRGEIALQDVVGEGEGFRGTPYERDPMDLGGTFSVAKQRAMQRFEHAYLSFLMRRSQGNLSQASREADLARHYLRDLLKKRGLYELSWSGDDSDSP
jgi:DNA-binding NtrC family response regulator